MDTNLQTGMVMDRDLMNRMRDALYSCSGWIWYIKYIDNFHAALNSVWVIW